MDPEEMQKAYQRALEYSEPAIPNHENIEIDREIIKQWLETKHTTLWSTWAIDDEKGRDKASDWLYNEIESLVQFTVSRLSVTA